MKPIMQLFIIAIYCSLMFLTGCSHLFHASTENRLQALRQLAQTDFNKAQQQLKQLKQQQPENPQVWLLSGELALQKQHCDQAQVAFKQAQRYGSEAENSYLGLGICADKQGQHQQAEKYYTQGIEHYPHSWRLQNNLAYSRLLQGDVQQALADLKLLAEHFDQPAVHHNLAIAWAMNGNYEQAYHIERRLYDDATALKNRTTYQQLSRPDAVQ